MGRIRPVLGLATALIALICGQARAQNPTPTAAAARNSGARPLEAAPTASAAISTRDPDTEVPYVPPRRVIAPPVYGDPGLPLNPGGVPYDDLFASPYPFDIPDSFLRPEDPYAD